MGDSKGPIRLKGLFVFGAVTLGLGYAVPIAGSAAGPSATPPTGPSRVAYRQALGSPPRVLAGSFKVGVTHATAVQSLAIDFAIRSVDDPALPLGTSKIETAGVAGLRVETIAQTLEDDFVVDQQVVTEKVTPAVEQVVRVGSARPDPPLAAALVPASQTDPTLAGARAIAGSATSYCLTGRTATGTLAGPGAIAVDPRVIPLHSHLYVPGYGHGWAVDTGSAIIGTLVDVWLDCEAAIRWGRRAVTIYVLPS